MSVQSVENDRTPHTHGGTDAPECTPYGTRCRSTENDAIVSRWERQAREREALADRLADEYLPDLPKPVADKAFALAWEHGHSAGEGEVENYYIDFADLAVTAYHERVIPPGSGGGA